MKNAEWLLKQGIEFNDIYVITPVDYMYIIEDKTGRKFGKVTNVYDELSAFKKWLDQEYVEQILDDAERQYLKYVIRPFRDRIEYIAKVREEPLPRFYKNDGIVKYYISIHFNDENDDIAFPLFREDAMYKGMEPFREYTLEELGL